MDEFIWAGRTRYGWRRRCWGVLQVLSSGLVKFANGHLPLRDAPSALQNGDDGGARTDAVNPNGPSRTRGRKRPLVYEIT